MIEIERDFMVDAEVVQKVEREAIAQTEKILRDVYLDTPDFILTKKDQWLRMRNGNYELKIPSYAEHAKTDQYQELEDEASIRQALGIASSKPLADSLSRLGFEPFCTCHTKRREYRIGEFTIDIDYATYDNSTFVFQTAEIEILIGRPEEIIEAENKLLSFAERYGFRPAKHAGKVIEYLKYERPVHYQALSGVIHSWETK